MKHKWAITLILVGAILLTGCMSASFSGNYVVKAGETVRGNLVATSGSVFLEAGSQVTGTILLTSGALHIGKNAQVGRDVVLTSGALYLAEGAVVQGDVILANEDIEVQQAPGSQIEGSITTNIVSFAISFITRGVLLYCVLPLALLIGLILVLGVWLGRSSRKKVEVVQAPAPVAAPASAPVASSVATTEDAQTRLQQLKALLDQGLISEADYEAKKADILAKM